MSSGCLFVFRLENSWRRLLDGEGRLVFFPVALTLLHDNLISLYGLTRGRLEPTRSCEDCHAERNRGISGFSLRHTNKSAFSIQRRTLKVQCSDKKSAGGGARTHTILRSLDFESSASANSATPALFIINYL